MGPTINGLDKLLQLPSGCGEQNMIHFAPDVFIYKYLSSTNQDNSVIKEKALKYMEIGRFTPQVDGGKWSEGGEGWGYSSSVHVQLPDKLCQPGQ